MTCREFMESAEELNLSELLRVGAENDPLTMHGRECSACGNWLYSQHSLAGAMQSLSAATAQRQASSKVEQAVLQAFRTQGFAPKVIETTKPAAAPLWTLSRLFEFGAYAAIAAALIVGVFLGWRIVRDRNENMRAQQAQTITTPANVSAPTATAGSNSQNIEQARKPEAPNLKRGDSTAGLRAAAVKQTPQPRVRTVPGAGDGANYVALMLCDPLICSGDEHVIRMELPVTGVSSAEASSGTVLADVVIGEDGLVRGMRIVN